MGPTRKVLSLGPVAVEVPAVAGANLEGDGRFVAWAGEDLLTVRVGRYAASLTDDWLLVLRKYEYVDQ